MSTIKSNTTKGRKTTKPANKVGGKKENSKVTPAVTPSKSSKPKKKPAAKGTGAKSQPGAKAQPKTRYNVTQFCQNEELISFGECRRILTMDAPLLSKRKDALVNSNDLSYYILCNTWLFQAQASAGLYYNDLLDHMRKNGLISTIKKCSDIAASVIDASNVSEHTALSPVSVTEDFGFMYGIISSCDNLQHVLQLLRYPKRYCPIGADVVRDRGIAAFKQINAGCWATNQSLMGETHTSITDDGVCYNASTALRLGMQYYVHKMLHGYSYDPERGFFSNGAASDAKSPVGCKLKAFNEYSPNLLDIRFPLAVPSGRLLDQRDDYTCAVTAVPKSYKTPRIIAMESSYRQFYMQAIRIAMENRLRINNYNYMIDVSDQKHNRDACFTGALTCGYSTIDLSSASDSLARHLVWDVFPSQLVFDMQEYLSKWMRIGDERPYKVEMFSTSGSALTFVTQSITYLAICLSVYDRVSAFAGRKLLPPVVFGDDMVVDTFAFPAIMEALGTLGFTVNTDKSFGGMGTYYRESCGVEYHNGIDVASKYFPRTPLEFKTNPTSALASLCSLQHKLYDNLKCRYFLIEVVRSLKPNMTSHEPGTECADLWESIPTRKVWYIGPKGNKNSVRYKHMSPKAVYPKLTGRSDELELIENAEMWRYRHFLMYGPSFEDKLLELLNVTEAPSPIEYDLYQSETKWVLTRES